MLNNLTIESHRGQYLVEFVDSIEELEQKIGEIPETTHVIIDSQVAKLFRNSLLASFDITRVVEVEVNERAKSFQELARPLEQLLSNNIKRSNHILAIGGGVIQDIACFIATTLFRGIDWSFIPTTLLAQADSCIGSKSSINVGGFKNIIGTFYPPKNIWISNCFLETLSLQDMKSGFGEILKVHAIAGKERFAELVSHFDKLPQDSELLSHYIWQSLYIKKEYIEFDEFDKGIRNIFNYGHSFGHAIESASAYQVPHGVAVCMGMDMANYVGSLRGIVSRSTYHDMHDTLQTNYRDFKNVKIDIREVLGALSKDKKNVDNDLKLIFPVGELGEVSCVRISPDEEFTRQCREFIEKMLENE